MKRLNTKIFIHEIQKCEVKRIAELTQRTHKCTIGYQYTVNEINRKSNQSDSKVFVVEANDTFSELGIIGCFAVGGETLDLFCVSCRVLGRKVENQLIEYLLYNNIIKNTQFVENGKNMWLKEVFKHYQIPILLEKI